MNWKGVQAAVTDTGSFTGGHPVKELAPRGARIRARVRYIGAKSRGDDHRVRVANFESSVENGALWDLQVTIAQTERKP